MNEPDSFLWLYLLFLPVGLFFVYPDMALIILCVGGLVIIGVFLLAAVGVALAILYDHTPWQRSNRLPSWCQGCDQLPATRLMDFTDSGLYWCDTCRNPEQVINPKPLYNPMADVLAAAFGHDSHDSQQCHCYRCENHKALQKLATQQKA